MGVGWARVGGASQSFGCLNHQCCMGIPGRKYGMGINGGDTVFVCPVGDTRTAS